MKHKMKSLALPSTNTVPSLLQVTYPTLQVPKSNFKELKDMKVDEEFYVHIRASLLGRPQYDSEQGNFVIRLIDMEIVGEDVLKEMGY